jgi:hypothetical protein
LEVILEKCTEGLTWSNLLKFPVDQQQLPLSDGLGDELSAEELERANKMLAEMRGATDNGVSLYTS